MKLKNISILELIFPLRVTVFVLSLFFIWRPVVVLFKTKLYVVFFEKKIASVKFHFCLK